MLRKLIASFFGFQFPLRIFRLWYFLLSYSPDQSDVHSESVLQPDVEEFIQPTLQSEPAFEVSSPEPLLTEPT